MKTILLISLLLSSQLLAGDLIFKDGFDNNAALSGTASGISSSGLVLQLTSDSITENLSVNVNGTFEFSNRITIGADWNVNINTLPTNPEALDCELINNSGTMTMGGVNDLEVSCNDSSLNWDQDNWDNGNWN
ncbi:MAG: hypothetical protein AB8B80_04495 [Marinicellaceae bacterium]